MKFTQREEDYITRLVEARDNNDNTASFEITEEILTSDLAIIIKYYLLKGFKISNKDFFEDSFRGKTEAEKKVLRDMLVDLYDTLNEDESTQDLFHKGVGLVDEYAKRMK